MAPLTSPIGHAMVSFSGVAVGGRSHACSPHACQRHAHLPNVNADAPMGVKGRDVGGQCDGTIWWFPNFLGTV